MTAKKTRTAEQPTFWGDISPALRKRAFDRLVEFAKNPQFAPSFQAAYDEFWSEEFGRRSDAAKAAAFARNEAEGGFITYSLLDVAVAGGSTIAKAFLEQRGEHLPKREREYLERLAATRMGLYEVTVVNRDRGLTLVDLWNDEHIAVREQLLTHNVSPGSVVATRIFPALDGATELEGVVYIFSRRQAEELIAILRGEWEVSREKEPSLSEERFLKRRAGPLTIDPGSTTSFLKRTTGPQLRSSPSSASFSLARQHRTRWISRGSTVSCARSHVDPCCSNRVAGSHWYGVTMCRTSNPAITCNASYRCSSSSTTMS